jgi:hypothetical protein
MNASLCPARKLYLFALLSGADFVLTWHLLRQDGGAYEGNPLAAWCLDRGGWLGLAAFKAAAVLTTGGLSLLICRRRPLTGQRVLAFSCAALAAVVLYSGYLCERARHRTAGLDPDEAAPLLARARQLDAAVRRSAAYREVMTRVTEDLHGRRCTLAEAAGRLARTEQGRDPAFLRSMRLFYPGLSDAECLAVCVLNSVAPKGSATAADRQLLRELEAEFRALYGRAAPTPLPPGRPPLAPGAVAQVAPRPSGGGDEVCEAAHRRGVPAQPARSLPPAPHPFRGSDRGIPAVFGGKGRLPPQGAHFLLEG